MLILKTTYNAYWHLPGGIVERYESPREAIIRKVKEETNLDLVPKDLIAINHHADVKAGIDAMVFIIAFEIIEYLKIHEISYPTDEMKDFKFHPYESLIDYLDPGMGKLLEELNLHNEIGSGLYFENMNLAS